jgi:hypothetical protein
LCSCSPDSKLTEDEARIKGRIVNPSREYVVLKNIRDSASKPVNVKLNEKGEFEIIVKPDTAGLCRFEYEEMNSTNISSIMLMLHKGYDLKIWIDTKNPELSLSVSGKGAEVNKYVASKGITDDAFEDSVKAKLTASPEEYLKILSDYKVNVDALLTKLPANAPDVPKGFKEEEAKSFYFNFNRLKILYAIENMHSSISSFITDEKFFSFLNEIPFDKPELIDDPGYMLLVSTYADYLAMKKNMDDQLPDANVKTAKYLAYNDIFKDQKTRDVVLFNYLKNNISESDSAWYKNAIKDFETSSLNDSLKRELGKLKEPQQK